MSVPDTRMKNPFADIDQAGSITTESAKNAQVIELEQKSKEWFLARWDKFTGSRIPNLMKQGREKNELWGATAMNIILELASYATMTPEGRDQYAIEQMYKDFMPTRWGNTYEPEARDAYAVENGIYEVRETGFKVNPNVTYMGGSFDGECYFDGEICGIIEIKCPYDPIKHDMNLNLSKIGLDPKHDYYGQIQCNIEVAGVDWCDFISYDPRRVESHKLVVIRVERDQIYINAMLDRVHKAKAILDGYLKGRSLQEMVKEVEA